MIVNQVVTGVIAIIIGYLLGSFPSGYIITRNKTGKDIRQLGSGNAGARNVFREVDLAAAIPVALLDIGKGAAAVAIAYWLLDAPLFFVLAAGLAAIAGHMWSIYRGFTGGNGLAAAVGVLAVLLTRELLIVFAIMLLITVITRNPVLSFNISLLSLPISIWFLQHSWISVIFSILLLLILIINFIPTARAALARTGSKKRLTAELFPRSRYKN